MGWNKLKAAALGLGEFMFPGVGRKAHRQAKQMVAPSFNSGLQLRVARIVVQCPVRNASLLSPTVLR